MKLQQSLLNTDNRLFPSTKQVYWYLSKYFPLKMALYYYNIHCFKDLLLSIQGSTHLG